jgi:hypothetical protein
MKVIRILGTLAALAAGILMALPTSPASAAPNRSSIHAVWDYFYGSPNQRVTGTVSCPSGERLVSGGFGNGQLVSLTPTNTFTGVTVTAILDQGIGYLAVEAVCSPASGFSDVITRVLAFPGQPGSNFRRGVVTCPAGMFAFGGGSYMETINGYRSTTAFAMVSNTPGVAGNTWTAAASTTVSTDRLVITTQCAPLPGSFLTSGKGPLTNAGGPGVYKDCPSGYTALSGGVYLLDPYGNEAPGIVTNSVWADRGSGITSWFTSGKSSTPNNQVVSLVRCIP